MLHERIGFIGAGQMATALGQALVKAGLTAGERLLASDVSSAAAERFAAATGGSIAPDNAAVTATADVVFLAVKPQQMPPVLREIGPQVTERTLLVSIAAGIRLQTLAAGVGSGARLIRVMPNTPCLVGHGACAYSAGPNATAADRQLIARLLGAVGLAIEVEEKLLDAVTGLSGSGPAFVYMVIEALADGGVRMGLPRATAAALAAHTVRGAAEMVLSSHEHPAVLKDRVASPGGTTIAGIETLEAAGLRGAMIAAVAAAARRSAELSGPA
jgi:pyrroline-5-carboxylate reductase